MNLSELIPFLKQAGIKPKKSLSQNFLVDSNIVRKIIQTAEIAPGDPVLEIGPGPGALTRALLKEGAQVFAIEKDPLFAQNLSRLKGNLFIHEADFLTFPMLSLPKSIKVVANLPYHITTPILEKLFKSSFSSLTIMVQREVAMRMMARPSTKQFGSLSLFVQFYTTFHSSFPVSSRCFYPQPKVGSTVIRLDHTSPPDLNPFHLISAAFQHRRKMLTSSLPYPKEHIKDALAAIGVRPDARPENLSLDQWLQLLTRALKR